MSSITVNVWLYGELSCYGKAVQHAGDYSTVQLQMLAGSKLQDLMDYLLMCTNERGFTFINEKMSAMPNIQPDLDHVLQDGDRIYFFPLKMFSGELQFDLQLTDKMNQIIQTSNHQKLYDHSM